MSTFFSIFNPRMMVIGQESNSARRFVAYPFYSILLHFRFKKIINRLSTFCFEVCTSFRLGLSLNTITRPAVEPCRNAEKPLVMPFSGGHYD
jgi:hypothetical protein